MQNSFLPLMLLLFFTNLSAQDCNCPEQFAFAKEKITTNYSGYKDKVTPKNQEKYDAFTQRYQQLTANTKVDSTCFRLVYEWTRWFKDGHIQMGNNSQLSPEEIRAQFADWETIKMSEEAVKELFPQIYPVQIEGIWESDNGAYKVAILSRQNLGKKGAYRDFVGFILKGDDIWWMPGQVKFELKNTDKHGNVNYMMDYYMQNHSKQTIKAQLSNHVLSIEGLGNWYKIYPEKAERPANTDTQKMYSLNRLDDNTLLLTIPTMNNNYRKEMKQLVKENKKLIASTPNLVIDCRNNGGGSDLTYFPLRRFIYTNPVIDYHGQTYCTEDNVKMMYELSKDKNFNSLMRFYFKRQYKKQSKHIGEYLGKTGTFERKYRRKKHTYPENIAVLINKGCGSSCESFAFMCNQSKKVTLMGQNTSGISDYGNLHELPFPNGKWNLYYATTRNSAVDAGKGIDNIGIPPHVRLDDTTSDWIVYAKDYLKQKK